MSDPQTAGTYRLPDSLADELEKLGRMAQDFRRGDITAARFQAFRVPQGVYEQREDGRFMLRVRLPAGALLPHQMRVLAEVARRYGSGRLHVTTRQDIQVHEVPVESIHPALTTLAKAGLSTKGGGGNTVRNVLACHHAGVCAQEAFDVTPQSIALTEYLLADPLNFQLPRKYKIAFSGCGKDCAGATVNDVGFIAKRRDGAEGFTVYAAGGMGARSRVGTLLEEFIPTEDIFLVAEAVKRVFDQHGDRRNKHKARLRFLVKRIGFDAFRDLYRTELTALREDRPAVPEIRPIPHVRPESPAGGEPTTEIPLTWRRRNVAPQKQDGRHLVAIALHLGDIGADLLEKLADVVKAHGEGMLRTTQSQSFVLRGVTESELPSLHGALAPLGLTDSRQPVIRDIVACAGAATCRLGICLSRGLAEAVAEQLEQSDLDLGDDADGPRIHISGCPNSCGRHPIAAIGLFGAARRVGSRLVPHYVVQLGGRVEEGQTRLAEGDRSVPAHNVPAMLADLLGAFKAATQFPDFQAFLAAGGRTTADELATRYAAVPDFEEDKNFYFDWSADSLFSLAGRGAGECGAGVFDLIEVDLASAADALAHGRLHAATVLAARALLVTRGQQPDNDADSLALFDTHFLEEDLVDAAMKPVIAAASRGATAADPEGAFDGTAEQVESLLSAVKYLYEHMDASLRFPAATAGGEPEKPAPEPVPAEPAEPTADATHDFRGVACPLNFVKTKLALAQIAAGQTLLVLLNEEGAKNVPASAESEGHQVLSVAQQGDHWRVLLRKGSS